MEAVAIIGSGGEVTRSGPADRVPWWSFTKTVLSIATLRLAQQGSLELDDMLPGERFSARQLLRHEAGLRDYGGLPQYHADVAAGADPWPPDRLLMAVDADRLLYEPGAGWTYSNTGYLRVAQMVVRVSRRDLAASLRDLVFEPAGLGSARLAVARHDLSDVQMGGTSSYHPGWVYHGLIVGTVTDAARLLWGLAHGGLLNPIMLAEMMDRRSLPDYRSEIHPDPAYGLGLMMSAEDPASHPIGHSGNGPGSRIAVYMKACQATAVWAAPPSTADVTARAYEILGA